MLPIIPYPNSVLINGLYTDISKTKITEICDSSVKPEAYEITVTDGIAQIKYSDENGLYYAKLTLNRLAKNGCYPQCIIKDEPKFSYRAFMIDSGRHMQTTDEIKRIISICAELKFNYFHWHLSEDQGFRIESKVYPFLNSRGSYREKIGFGNEKDTGRYGGYYTQDEIKDVVEFCKQKHIEVIPEIDIPGHTSSFLASYSWLGCRDAKIDVKTTNGVFDDILCAGKDEVYEFCYNLLTEVASLFPGKYFHIGGDEAPKKVWKNCPECQKKIKEQGLKNEEELQGYFTRKIVDFLATLGKTAIVWNDALKSGKIDNDTIVANWCDPTNRCKDFIKNGGTIIAENLSHLYIDQPYSLIPLKKTYGVNPYPKGTEKYPDSVMGIETPMWTEWLPTFEDFCYMMFPRIFAVAEAAWTGKTLDYDIFKERVSSYNPLLSALGIVPAPMNHWDPKGALKSKMSIQWAKHFK